MKRNTLSTPFAARFCFLMTVLLLANAPARADALRDILLEGEGWQLVSQGYRFTEGPAVDAAGNVFFTDVAASKIYRIDAATGEVTEFVGESKHANGTMFGPDGTLYACQSETKQIVKYDEQGRATSIAGDIAGNDLVVASDGGVYVTDPGKNRVCYIPPGGKRQVVAREIKYPNGVILTPDESTLVVTDFAGPRFYAFTVGQDGGLSHK